MGGKKPREIHQHYESNALNLNFYGDIAQNQAGSILTLTNAKLS